MLDRAGVKVDRFADSTGPLAGLDNPNYRPMMPVLPLHWI
jgi:hypothetical protein